LRGCALGFDAGFYPADQVKAVGDEIADAARVELEAWRAAIGQRLTTENLALVAIELFCVPLPSAEGFPRRLSDSNGRPRMSLAELQSWLVEEGLRDELDNLAIVSADDEVDAGPDWLFAGSILARSGERSQQDDALRIATDAIMLSSSNAVRDDAAV
jgi:hypothetical protein